VIKVKGEIKISFEVNKNNLSPPTKEQEHQIPHRGEESYNLLFYRQYKKLCFPKAHRTSVFHNAPPCRSVTSLLSKSWNPCYSTEWQSTTPLVLGGLPSLPPQCTQTQCSTLQLQENPCTPIKEQELQSPHWEKRGNQHHNKNPARGNIYSTPLSEDHCWSTRREKKHKTLIRGT
jgi:hypothetical protein